MHICTSSTIYGGREFLLCTALANRREMGEVLGHNERAISQELVCLYICSYTIYVYVVYMHNASVSVCSSLWH